MSKEVIASIATILAVVLPMFGVETDSVQVTGLVQSVVIVVATIYLWFKSLRSKEQIIGRKVNMLGGVVKE